MRNGRYCERLAVEDPRTQQSRSRRIPFDGVHSPAQALARLNELRKGKRDHALPILHRTPKFGDYAGEYLAYFAKAKDAKRPKTVARLRATRPRAHRKR